MAFNFDPNAQSGIWNSIKGAMGLFNKQNKEDMLLEDGTPTPVDPYESTLDAVEIMKLVRLWKETYSVYYKDIEKGQKTSFDYWVGKQRKFDDDSKDITDNLIFEAVETFLPIATKANPEPLVSADPSDIGQQIAKDVKVALVNWADGQMLRRKLARMTRGWLLNRVGVAKMGWNPITKTIELSVVNGKKMVFDKDGYIDEKGIFRGEYEGEKKQLTADKLIDMFPKKTSEINKKCQNKLGTKLEYFEWWYRGSDVIFTLDDILLGKYKNPNWNYDGQETSIDPMTNSPVITEFQGTNHLKERLSPYRYLSVFNTGEQPHDNTSLILQNIPLQDIINRREIQIERNVEGMNNGMVVNGEYFTEEQASQAASALRRGVAIRTNRGEPSKAVLFPQKPPLPADVFNNLKDSRQELRNIFGTAGSNAEGLKSQESVRGKILVNQMDSSRIGGGVTEYIEQVADSIYNLAVQFMFVYYDEEHFITTAGSISGSQLIILKNDKFPLLKTLDITVKEGTLVPKDPLTQRNEAIDLWSANAIDPLSLYKKLDFPNPQEAARQLILWQMLQAGKVTPEMYLPSFTTGGQIPGQIPPPVGVGDSDINYIGASAPGGIIPQQPAPTQSQQLLNSVPIR